jgi:flagellar hook assembly protein FlgD
VEFRLPGGRPARIEILDVAGRRVATLFDGVTGPGHHEVTWNGTDASGRPTPGGIYFVRMATAEGAQVRKVARLD